MSSSSFRKPAVGGGGDADALQMAPLRTMDEFLLGQARFQVPDVNCEDRWLNRVVNNLLYYQTNYFLSSLVIFVIVASMHPKQMAAGLGTMLFVFAAALFAERQKADFERYRRQNPRLVALGLLACGYFLVYQMGCIVVLLLGIALPLAFVFIHASLRLRNVKNKLANVTEAFGLAKKTPMSVILDALDLEVDLKHL